MRSETEQVLIDQNCATSTPEVEDISTTTFLPITDSITPKAVQPEIKKFTLNLSDALSALSNLDAVCQRHSNPSNMSDLWAPIRVKICHKKPELKAYSYCFKETALKLNGNCSENVSSFF